MKELKPFLLGILLGIFTILLAAGTIALIVWVTKL
jgi:hypothetical protein